MLKKQFRVPRSLLLGIGFLVSGWASSPVYAQELGGHNLALFIFGQPGTAAFDKLFDSAHMQLGRLLNQNGFNDQNSQVYFRASSLSEKTGELSSRQHLNLRIPEIAAKGPYDKLFLFVAGHVNGRDDKAILHLPGEDMPVAELIGKLQQIKAGQTIVVAAVAQGQLWTKAFSAEHHIVIVGNSQREFDFIPIQFLTFFPAMFEEAARWHMEKDPSIQSPVAVSLTEVFLLTARTVNRWYVQNNLMETEEPYLEASGDGKAESVWLKDAENEAVPQSPKISPQWFKEAHATNKILFAVSAAGGSHHELS